MGEQQTSEYYDDIFANKTWSQEPSTDHPWMKLWQSVAARIEELDPRTIVDVGCGPGQLAHLLAATEGEFNYVGYDFSAVATEKASRLVTDERFTFAHADAREADLDIGDPDSRLYVMCEFLEHVSFDIEVISRIPAGADVIITLPMFDDPGHVRFFKDHLAGLARYQPYLEDASSIMVDEARFMITGKRKKIEKPTVPLTLCMIVKDEEIGIPRAIGSVQDLVEDIVVLVDSKTTDESAQVARACGARVFDYEWNDDFAHARNLAIEKARTEWVLMLDGHEYISNPEDLGAALEKHKDAASLYLTIRMETGKDFCYHRIFQKSKGAYKNPAHNILDVKGRQERCDEVIVIHDRYGGQSDESRAIRNAQRDEHLSKVLNDNIAKNGCDTRSMFYLAQQHYDAWRWEAAYYWYERYNRTEGGNQWAEERFRAYYLAGRAALALGDYTNAIDQGKKAAEKMPDRAEGWALLGDIHYRREEWGQALDHYLRANQCELPRKALLTVEAGVHKDGVGVLDQISMCYWRLGLYEKGAEVCESILEHEDLNDGQRARIQANLDWHLKKLGE